ncbi:MAG: hypothetical protein EZS28_043531, partial [Streblomastix strix]
NTVTMYCLNQGKGSITIASLVDKVFKLAEQYSWTIKASHIPDLSNTIPDSISRLSRCGDYAIKREVLQRTLTELVIQFSIEILRHTRTDNTRGIVVSLKTSFLSSEMDSSQNGPKKFYYYIHQSFNY